MLEKRVDLFIQRSQCLRLSFHNLLTHPLRPCEGPRQVLLFEVKCSQRRTAIVLYLNGHCAAHTISLFKFSRGLIKYNHFLKKHSLN